VSTEHILFLYAQSPTFTSWVLLLPKVFVSFRLKFLVMAKLHFRSVHSHQTVLFPQRIDWSISD